MSGTAGSDPQDEYEVVYNPDTDFLQPKVLFPKADDKVAVLDNY